MAEKPEQPKTLEMRVAELEDKISKVHITEEEMKTYQKVAAALGVGAPSMPAQVSGQAPQYFNCLHYQCYYYQCYYHQCYYNQCYRQCYTADCIQQQQAPTVPTIPGGFGSFGR